MIQAECGSRPAPDISEGYSVSYSRTADEAYAIQGGSTTLDGNVFPVGSLAGPTAIRGGARDVCLCGNSAKGKKCHWPPAANWPGGFTLDRVECIRAVSLARNSGGCWLLLRD